jgi:hypothetical protein
MMKEFPDVFAWSYTYLKTYATSIMQHKIPLKSDTKPIKQELRHLNPMLLPIIEKEIKKLWDTKIIVPSRFLNWVANIVPTRKKNGEIRICVDFQNLNKCSLKDNYMLPKMDHILESVVSSKRISMIDGYSSYNQITVHKDDQEKMAFTTPWGIFMYDKMPFGLINAGETFQCAMDIDFVGEKNRFTVVYLDDITTFSQLYEEHLRHLKQTFQKCRKFGLLLNPKKSLFAMEGQLLGHIVTSKVICIHLDRFDAIKRFNIPRNKKEIQSFLEKVNFLRRFIPNYAKITKEITYMLRKETRIKWGEHERRSFSTIKLALTEAPVLISPYYSK